MSNSIEKVVSSYIANEKNKNDESDGKFSSKFPSDTVLAAKEVDNAIDKLNYKYELLKNKIRRDSSLTNDVKEAVKDETDSIIKSY